MLKGAMRHIEARIMILLGILGESGCTIAGGIQDKVLLNTIVDQAVPYVVDIFASENLLYKHKYLQFQFSTEVSILLSLQSRTTRTQGRALK